jgi:hypothetical protein
MTATFFFFLFFFTDLRLMTELLRAHSVAGNPQLAEEASYAILMLCLLHSPYINSDQATHYILQFQFLLPCGRTLTLTAHLRNKMTDLCTALTIAVGGS